MSEYWRIPQQGQTHPEILKTLKDYKKDDANWADARTFGLIYHHSDEHEEFLKEAHNIYFSENGLNPLAFKSLKKLEHEIVRMACSLFHGEEDAVGTVTIGGTESLLMAVKTYRDRKRKKQIFKKGPLEIIAPQSVHVAVDKAAHYFGMKVVHIPLDSDYRVDVKKLEKAINRKTAMIVASAPQYPHGVMDPIEEIGAIALRHKIPLHVDSCLGGFMLPFLEMLGEKIPPFDFRVPGVTSISADLHKYAHTCKGTSLVLYKNEDYLQDQFFVYTDWPGGIYASPTMPGSKPGGPIAAAWASLVSMGVEGFKESARRTLKVTRSITEAINAMEELKVIGRPIMTAFAFKTTGKLNIFALADALESKGWHFDRQQRPNSIHMTINPNHEQVYQELINDIKTCVEEIKKNPQAHKEGSAPIYGLMSSMPVRSLVKSNIKKMMTKMYGKESELPDLTKEK